MSLMRQSHAREGKPWSDSLPDVRETLGALQAQLREVDERARALIQERPLTALAAAVALGYLLRRLQAFASR